MVAKNKKELVEEMEVELINENGTAGKTPDVKFQKLKLTDKNLCDKIYVQKRVLDCIIDDLKKIDSESMLEIMLFKLNKEKDATLLIINDTATRKKLLVCGFKQDAGEISNLKNKFFAEKLIIKVDNKEGI